MKLHSCAQEISVSELSIWAILLCRPIFTMKAVVLLTWNTNCYPTVLLNFFSKIMKDIVIIAQVSETQHLYCQIVLLSARWRDVVNKWVGKWVNYSTCRAPHQALARGGAKENILGNFVEDWIWTPSLMLSAEVSLTLGVRGVGGGHTVRRRSTFVWGEVKYEISYYFVMF